MMALSSFRIPLSLLLVAGLAAGCAESSWEAVDRENTIQGYNRFLTKHPESPFSPEAIQRVAYFRLVKHPTVEAFEEFEGAYPQNDALPDLRAEMEPKYYAPARSENTTAAYNEFLHRYPHGAMSARARGNLEYVGNVRARPNAEALLAFLAKHPESDFAAEAKSTLDLIGRKRDTRIRKLGVRVEVSPNVTQKERVRRGFAAMVARNYEELGIDVVLLGPGDGPPSGSNAWMRVDYHEAPASGVLGGRTLMSHCRVRLYHSDTKEPIWDRSFEAPADHMLLGAYGRDKTVFGNSTYRFWKDFFVPVSTWAASETRVQRVDYLEDVAAVDVKGDRAAVLLRRGGVDFLDMSSPLDPQVAGRYRRERDLTTWSGIQILTDDLVLTFGPDGAELVRWDRVGAERIASWESPAIGAVNDVTFFDDNTLLMAAGKGLYALRLQQYPLVPHRLLDGDYIGVAVRDPYVIAVQPERIEVSTPKHLMRHLTGSRIPMAKSFGAHKSRIAGDSLYVFGKTDVIRVSLANPKRPKIEERYTEDATGEVADLISNDEHMFTLGSRGLHISEPGSVSGGDLIQVEASRRMVLKERFALLVGNRTLEVLDLAPYLGTGVGTGVAAGTPAATDAPVPAATDQ